MRNVSHLERRRHFTATKLLCLHGSLATRSTVVRPFVRGNVYVCAAFASTGAHRCVAGLSPHVLLPIATRFRPSQVENLWIATTSYVMDWNVRHNGFSLFADIKKNLFETRELEIKLISKHYKERPMSSSGQSSRLMMMMMKQYKVIFTSYSY
jgi:hypothetical protein